ncbi:aspartate aminotransferase family protein [Glaciecola sp. MH2013]|uniref:pyridoxal phosphate-dependent decarboxylase family protein n=1 Tax=Glaciecola sp. MH2013 TaxID=2785524 RepID=UPI00189E7EE3|nr:pyridoxal-dependent decarboxylase [Glaciecola sp. MH2013]MBF7073206.1 aspartate aminotransferase family protein [Glaciecola sp. MH2013]
MSKSDGNNSSPVSTSFEYNDYLLTAIAKLKDRPVCNTSSADVQALMQLTVDNLPEEGLGEEQSLELLAPLVLGQAAYLDESCALAHMDPPTPWITWVTQAWNARLNQNLLHPATSPFAKEAEKYVVDWLSPFFGMDGGHMCSGSTVANLSALWAARNLKGVSSVIASNAAHISIKKAANILGLDFIALACNEKGEVDLAHLPHADILAKSCLVLTAGTTSAGAIDPLPNNKVDAHNTLFDSIKWLHVDAAWAGPLLLSKKYKHLLSGIEHADSVAVSAHKWLYQPKDSALIFFKDTASANPAISEGSSYLSTPNVGVQGSRSAAAVSLLATLLAWGQKGLSTHIESNMNMAEHLANYIKNHSPITCSTGDEVSFELFTQPVSAVSLFRPTKTNMTSTEQNQLCKRFVSSLPSGVFSTCELNEQIWVRSVAANPKAKVNKIIALLDETLQKL